MKKLLPLLLPLLVLSCQTPSEETTATPPPPEPAVCELLDLDEIGWQCDSLRMADAPAKAARLYFSTGEQHNASELFVYAAWQFNESGNLDSALIAVQRAIQYGMNNPLVLDKLGINAEELDSELGKEVLAQLKELENANRSIDNFEILTSPTDDFWAYHEKALKDSAKAKEHLASYICNGSSAIKDYFFIRYGNVNNMYEAMVKSYPDFYTHTRSVITPAQLQQVARESKAMMARFADLYEPAVFPKVYMMPGMINSSGTLSELGLFIGTEMFAKADNMPTENLSDWQKEHILGTDEMRYILVHELMHFQQSYGDEANRGLLLGKLIEEGVCDFLVFLVDQQRQVSSTNRNKLEYLKDNDNYDMIMADLQHDLYTSDLSKWMYNGGQIEDRPADLGYTMGYLICQSYYNNAEDKTAAIYELLNTDDFAEIVRGSNYKRILGEG